jgi:hypothetical protein
MLGASSKARNPLTFRRAALEVRANHQSQHGQGAGPSHSVGVLATANQVFEETSFTWDADSRSLKSRSQSSSLCAASATGTENMKGVGGSRTV